MVYNVEQMGFNGWKESAVISYEQLIAAHIRIFTLVYVLILWHQRSCGVFTLSRTLAIAVSELSLAAASTSVPVRWLSLQWGPDFFLCLFRPPSWKTTNLQVLSAVKGSHNRPWAMWSWKPLLLCSVNSKHLGSLSLYSDRNLFPLLFPARNRDNFPQGCFYQQFLTD